MPSHSHQLIEDLIIWFGVVNVTKYHASFHSLPTSSTVVSVNQTKLLISTFQVQSIELPVWKLTVFVMHDHSNNQTNPAFFIAMTTLHPSMQPLLSEKIIACLFNDIFYYRATRSRQTWSLRVLPKQHPISWARNGPSWLNGDRAPARFSCSSEEAFLYLCLTSL